MLRRVLLLAASFTLGGCAAFFLRDIHDFSRSGLQLVDLDATPDLEPEKWNVPRPYRPLRIGLLTQRDLQAFHRRTSTSVFLQASSYDSTGIDKSRWLGLGDVHVDAGHWAGRYDARPSEPAPGPRGYRVFIPLEQPP